MLSLEVTHRVLRIDFDGRLDDWRILAAYDEARRWMAAHGPAAQLSDFSRVVEFSVTTGGVQQLAMRPPLAPDEFARVVIAPSDVVFGMTRMFEMIGAAKRDQVHVVRSEAEAYALLGLKEPVFERV